MSDKWEKVKCFRVDYRTPYSELPLDENGKLVGGYRKVNFMGKPAIETSFGYGYTDYVLDGDPTDYEKNLETKGVIDLGSPLGSPSLTLVLKVQDQYGRPLTGAHISVDGSKAGLTNEQGEISVGGLYPGYHLVSVHALNSTTEYLVELPYTHPAEPSVKMVLKVNVKDETPPTTVHDYDGSWLNKDFTINLTATDDVSGVSETYYRINNRAVKAVSRDGQPRISTEGANNTLEYWSVDYAGNVEPHKILAGIKLDKTPPSVKASITPSDRLYAGSEIVFNASPSSDNMGIASFEWDFGDGEKAAGMSVTHRCSNPGTYKVTLTVRDLAGNAATHTITVTVEASPSPSTGTPTEQTLFITVAIVVITIVGYMAVKAKKA